MPDAKNVQVVHVGADPALAPPSVVKSLDESAASVEGRPTPDQIDVRAHNFLELRQRAAQAAKEVAAEEAALVALVNVYGSVVPKAEKSRRLAGRLSELTLTKSDTITIVDDRVDMLKEALEANGRGDFFSQLFTEHRKWEIVKGAADALKSVALPKRLAERVLNLYGRCLSVKAKKPTLKVTIADPSQPARRPRARKGDSR